MTTTQDPNGIVVTVVQPVKALLDSTGAMKVIEEGINTFMEYIPWLMKGLDEIARIHPVVTGIQLFLHLYFVYSDILNSGCPVVQDCLQNGNDPARE